MKFLKSIAAFAISACSLAAFAGNIPSTVISDSYIGAGHSQDVNGASKYDIQSMTVSRTGTWMTVDIFTNFVGHNDDNSIGFGDLFMAVDENNPNANPWKPAGTNANGYNTDRFAGNDNNGNHIATTNTDWNYAYTLQDWTSGSGGDWDDRDNLSSGKGRLVSGFGNSDLRHSNTSGNRHHQAVGLKNSSYNSGNTQHAYDNIHYAGNSSNANGSHWNYGWNNWSAGNGKISFAFDVAGTYLESANQIAFRWAMTCANDIIEGMVKVHTPKPPTQVPEPGTILLMLLGLAGISYRRKLIANK